MSREASEGRRFTAPGARLRDCALCWLVCACCRPAAACDIPVFQYALTLWPADAYEAVVVHQDEPVALQTLTNLRAVAGHRANLVVRETPPDPAGGPFADILAAQPAASLPWLVWRYPVRQETRQVVWSGAITPSMAADWLDSPFRQALVQRLKEGCAGVWIMLESGRRNRDDAAFRVLSDELARLERVLRLAPGGTGHAPVFARMRLSRADPREGPLIAMLMGSEPDLAERRDDPIVFPVYGRGLVLHALIGSGIHAATITHAAEFLTGACSCEVKSQNPGLELLLTADWDEIQPGGLSDFQSRAVQAVTLLADVRGVPPSRAPAGGASPAPGGPPTARRDGQRLGPGGWLAGASLLAAVAVWRLIRRRKRSER